MLGPCPRLAVKLDVHCRVIQWKCPWCSKATGAPVYREFAAETGERRPSPRRELTRSFDQ